jgi:hypothetical protein
VPPKGTGNRSSALADPRRTGVPLAQVDCAGVSGSSNSRCGARSDRNPGRPKLAPPSPRQWRKVHAAYEEGRISATEAETLVGYLWMAQFGVIGERTDRRRRAQLRELGIPVREGIDLLAWQLAQRFKAGELTYSEAERELGRAALDQARARLR